MLDRRSQELVVVAGGRDIILPGRVLLLQAKGEVGLLLLFAVYWAIFLDSMIF